jgi:hypothetical protein
MDFPPYVRQPSLRPGDVVVALGLCFFPGASHAFLAAHLGGAQSWIHGALKRLHLAGLADRRDRVVVRGALLAFLDEGLARSFPAILAPATTGTPTAWVTPPGRPILGRIDPRELPVALDPACAAATPRFVWPSPIGSAHGIALMPLRPNAAAFSLRSPSVYRVLAVVDALRVGAGDRARAIGILQAIIGASRRRRTKLSAWRVERRWKA